MALNGDRRLHKFSSKSVLSPPPRIIYLVMSRDMPKHKSKLRTSWRVVILRIGTIKFNADCKSFIGKMSLFETMKILPQIPEIKFPYLSCVFSVCSQ